MADIVVLGAGNFGTCLAQHLASRGHQVKIWHRDAAVVEAINSVHRNPKYLNFCELSDKIVGFCDPEYLAESSVSAVIIAVPTQAMRFVLQTFPRSIFENSLLVCANKGIDMQTYQLPIDVIREVFGDKIANQAVMLSGPSFASEVVTHQPTCVVAASHSEAYARQAQDLFHTPFFRVYTNDDPIGLEVAGALKNVIAIAVGAASGLGFQSNTRAALMSRGLAEITRMGVRLGAQTITFGGLGGVGDLFLTCTSEKSRNYSVGFRLGKGEPLESILATMGSVAEGVYTAKAAHHLAAQLNIRAPIMDQVYSVLYQGKPIRQSFHDLVSGSAREEFELPSI
jgi:glycerol-3-phosphate dehydrogenase (NAD(P)+)